MRLIFQKVVEGFRVNIIGLGKKAHEFQYHLGKPFFDEFGKDLLEDGDFEATVVLDKQETFIEGTFIVSGTARLVCDRSLEPFDQAINTSKKVVFKYGNEESEVTDEIVIIPHDKPSLNIGQYLYEFIGLALPMKRLHPKYQEQDDDGTDGKIIYSSSTESEGDIDPRWEKLKKLK